MALDYDIVQVVAFDRLYFITREEFVRLERRSQLLWELLYANASMSTIRHILDESLSTDEVAQRFAVWQQECSANEPPPPPASLPDKW